VAAKDIKEIVVAFKIVFDYREKIILLCTFIDHAAEGKSVQRERKMSLARL